MSHRHLAHRPTYREEFAEDLGPEVRQALAVRQSTSGTAHVPRPHERGLRDRAGEDPDEMVTPSGCSSTSGDSATPVTTSRCWSPSATAVARALPGGLPGREVVGASVGFLARHEETPRCTATSPDSSRVCAPGRRAGDQAPPTSGPRSGDGLVMDVRPLVRGNAWFNIEVLGAGVYEYLLASMVDDDVINAGDERPLFVAWDVEPARLAPRASVLKDAGRRRVHPRRHRHLAADRSDRRPRGPLAS